ncbi:MAG: hypothetical protein AAB512_03105 [Patescibacteria group bacterium]
MRLFKRITSYEITKRQKLVFMSFFLSFVLVATQTVPVNLRYQAIAVLGFASVLLAAFALWGELSGIKYFLLLLLPVYFVIGASLFYFLLPVRWLTRLPFAFVFGISVYLLMLTSNIYNIAAIRTIALLRAAHAVGLLFSLVSTFFLTNVLLSLHFGVYVIVPAVIVISFPVYLVGLWSYELEDFISRKVFVHACTFTLISAEIAAVISFWPVAPINGALIMVTIMYVLLGLGQFVFHEKIRPRVIWEHLAVASIVMVIVVVATKWNG